MEKKQVFCGNCKKWIEKHASKMTNICKGNGKGVMLPCSTKNAQCDCSEYVPLGVGDGLI